MEQSVLENAIREIQKELAVINRRINEMLELKADLVVVQDNLREINSKFNAAFLKDESGELDLASHKFFHKKQDSIEQNINDTKNKLYRDLLSWLAAGAITVVVTSLWNQYFGGK